MHMSGSHQISHFTCNHFYKSIFGNVVNIYVFIAFLRDRHRPEHQSGSDPHPDQRVVRPQWEEGGQVRPQQQPRGQEPSRPHRKRPGSGPPPPPHRDRGPRDRDQVATKDKRWTKLIFKSSLSLVFNSLICQFGF